MHRRIPNRSDVWSELLTLGHVAKAKALGVGLSIGMVLLDQIVPGSGA
jgi:hypothetical protein